MKRDEYIEANRAKWNETAGIHAKGYVVELLERIEAPDSCTFDDVEKRIFAEIGLEGKAAVQLGCNNGRELISVKKAGAGRCVGVDISDAFVEQGRELARRGRVEVEFLRSSVYDLSHDLDGQFDMAYITIGVLGWLPDLEAFFGVVSRLLRKDGWLFLYEMHPILSMYEAEKGLVVDASYFRMEPFVEGESPDYRDPSQVVQAVSYWFPYTLGDVIGGCLRQGLTLTHFGEYGHDISEVYASFERLEKRPPLSFSLLARKLSGAR
jgi:SAM-dependent methyltransferase